MGFSHGLGPGVALVLKHWSLWIKLHIQVSEFKWRTHNNSILWPHLPSIDTWICCAHSFTCTAWYKKNKKPALQLSGILSKTSSFSGTQSSHLFCLWLYLILPSVVQCSQVPLLPWDLCSWTLFSPASSFGGFMMAVVAIGMIHLS